MCRNCSILANLVAIQSSQPNRKGLTFFSKMQQEYKQRNVGGFNPQHLSDSKGFDGKKVRRAIQRRTVDYNPTILRYLEMRLVGKERKHHLAIQPESHFVVNYYPAFAYTNPVSSVTTKFIHASTNKVRCPINTISVRISNLVDSGRPEIDHRCLFR